MNRKWMLSAVLILAAALSFTGCARKKACVCPTQTAIYEPVAEAAPAVPSSGSARRYIK